MKCEIKLAERYLMDLKKPDIDKIERAEIIRHIMNQKNLSIRAFAVRYRFNKSTIEDWLLWGKLTRTQYNDMKNARLSHTDIYRTLRNNKTKDINLFSRVDLFLDKCISILNNSANINSSSEITKEKLELLEKAINTFKFRLEKKNK